MWTGWSQVGKAHGLCCFPFLLSGSAPLLVRCNGCSRIQGCSWIIGGGGCPFPLCMTEETADRKDSEAWIEPWKTSQGNLTQGRMTPATQRTINMAAWGSFLICSKDFQALFRPFSGFHKKTQGMECFNSWQTDISFSFGYLSLTRNSAFTKNLFAAP